MMDREDLPSLRVPPHSTEAEQSVLGGLLLDNQAWDRAAELLVESDFYSHQHRAIWEAIGSLVQLNKPADVVTVFERLQAVGKHEDAGGLTYLNAIAQSVPGAANMRRYAEIVRERSVLRKIIAVCDEGATAAFNTQGKLVRDVLDAFATKVSALDRERVQSGPVQLRDLTAGRVDRINDLAAGNLHPGWPTGFPGLDNATGGGLNPGQFIVLAARPAIGKSSFAEALGLKLAADGLPTLMLSQEMPKEELADRAISHLGDVDSMRLKRGRLNDADWGHLTDGLEKAAGLPFWVDDQSGLRLSDMRAKARSIKGLKVLIVDYLQLSAGSGKGDNRNTEIEEITRGLKSLAKQLGIVVIALSQLSREVEKRPNKRPQMSDLRDSGGIEQDADIVIFLWPLRELEKGRSKLIGCAIDKVRGGVVSEFALEFRGATHWWGESTEPVHVGEGRNSNGGFGA